MAEDHPEDIARQLPVPVVELRDFREALIQHLVVVDQVHKRLVAQILVIKEQAVLVQLHQGLVLEVLEVVDITEAEPE